MVGLLGRKFGMTQIYDENGNDIPVTVLEVGPCVVTDIRTSEKDGYSAVQLGYREKKEKNVKKPVLGQFRKNKIEPKQILREFRTDKAESVEIGSKVVVSTFEAGDYVDVTGSSIGKGYQGVVKRHGFSGGERRHGSKFGREPGSIGMSATPARVFKGTKLPGQMGNKRVTVQNVKVLQVDIENNLLIVKGQVPGVEGGFVSVNNSVKKGNQDKVWKLYEEPKVEEVVEVKEEVQETSKEDLKQEHVKTKVEEQKEEAPVENLEKETKEEKGDK